LKKGILTKLDLAFSRDQDEKIYVQDRMLESSAELFRWLEKGAYFYVCGDALRMAKDVDATLRKIIEMEGNMTSEKADAYVNNLKKEKRYLRDVY
jgi:sulfite reductase (NADPH) flavoprotein alpha-component